MLRVVRGTDGDNHMTPLIWKGRLVTIRDGYFWLSRKGDYANFDVNVFDPDAAVAGSVGLSPITDIILEDGGLRLTTSSGDYYLKGDFSDGTAYIAKIVAITRRKHFDIEQHQQEGKPTC